MLSAKTESEVVHSKQHTVRLSNAQGTPVPIPNTEVKLRSADNTRRATAREDRSRRTRGSPLGNRESESSLKTE